MSAGVNPAASHHLPGFITAPGETDVLMIVSIVSLVAIVLGIGVFYFRLHALPEQIAHKGEKVQFQVVAVLGLLALFTHNHLFWILGLLLALIRIPDFSTPLEGMAGSLAVMAGKRPSTPLPEDTTAEPVETPPSQAKSGPAEPPAAPAPKPKQPVRRAKAKGDSDA